MQQPAASQELLLDWCWCCDARRCTITCRVVPEKTAYVVERCVAVAAATSLHAAAELFLISLQCAQSAYQVCKHAATACTHYAEALWRYLQHSQACQTSCQQQW